MKRDATRGHLDVLLLRVLVAGPTHGYGVIAALKDRSQGVFDLPEGTVYPSLHRLEDAGLVASEWASDTGRRRRIYRVTAAGHTSLVEKRRDWQRFSSGMSAVLGSGS